MANINRVILVGNLTRDPELRHTPSGTSVCKLRLAVNSRQKDASTGEWGEKPNYFDVTVWGNQGESCAQYLSKGRPVAVDGRLDWREFTARRSLQTAVPLGVCRSSGSLVRLPTSTTRLMLAAMPIPPLAAVSQRLSRARLHPAGP